MAGPPTRPHCPSAQPDWPGAKAIGIVGGTATAPEVHYLDAPLDVSPELLALSEPVTPAEVFRFAAPCLASACQHFQAGSCSLVAKVSRLPAARTGEPPPCAIRDRCRWWMQEGVAACQRCPAVVTDDFQPSAEMRIAADPSTPPAELLRSRLPEP